MSRWMSRRRGALSRWKDDDWGERAGRVKREVLDEVSPTTLVAGLVAVGLAAWALYTFGPELRRYLKIRSM